MGRKFTMRSLGLMLAMGAISGANAQRYQSNFKVHTEPETEKEKAKRFGLKEWHINGKTVYAATKRKAEKLAQNKTLRSSIG